MPFPPSPPPVDEAGAIIQPRQLNRWLDVNRVNPLTRTHTTITLPAFNVETQWKGYSEIVQVFNYEALSNFNLKALAEIPISPNYCLCVAWIDSNYTMHRYRIWENVGEVIYSAPPLYTGQMIGENFRLEVWSVAPTILTQFSLAGAGDAGTNVTYQRSVAYPQTVWESTDPFFAQTVEFNGTIWQALDAGSLQHYKLIDYTAFPFGLWEVGTFGSAPAPYAYIDTVCSSDAVTLFYTSKLGNYDYMWNVDTALAAVSTSATAFGNTNNFGADFILPLEFPVDSYPTINT